MFVLYKHFVYLCSRKLTNKLQIRKFMRKNFKENSPVRPNLMKMAVGDVITFPKSRVTTLRSTCATLGMEQDMVFQTRSDKQKGIITVTRIA